jgi:hypothetical protein
MTAILDFNLWLSTLRHLSLGHPKHTSACALNQSKLSASRERLITTAGSEAIQNAFVSASDLVIRKKASRRFLAPSEWCFSCSKEHSQTRSALYFLNPY